MKPGRVLDIKVANIVFKTAVYAPLQERGWRIDYRAKHKACNDPIWSDAGLEGWALKRYSTSDAAAWALLDRIGSFSVHKGAGPKYVVRVSAHPAWSASSVEFMAESETFAHAGGTHPRMPR
jgi:hypothetical protein